MKHISLPITITMMLGAACAVSCTSDSDRDSLLPTTEEEIRVDVADGHTRASVTTINNISSKPMMLFGDLDTNGEYFEGLKPIFNKAQVKKSSNTWDYGLKQYWLMGQVHSFVALHPYDIVNGMEGLKYEDSSVSFTYTMPKGEDNKVNYSGMPDLLVAAHRRKVTLGNLSAKVDFSFEHLMPRIKIFPALDERLMYENETDTAQYPDNKDEYILIHSIELQGLKTKANFKISPAALTTNSYSTYGCNVEYEIIDDSEDSAFMEMADMIKITNNKAMTDICNDNNALFVLPQKFGENSKARIVMTYTVNDDHPLRHIIIPIKDMEWESGKTYLYKFTIEKAYTGQIKPGSLTIEIDRNDFSEDKDDAWVNGGKIKFDFNADGTHGS